MHNASEKALQSLTFARALADGTRQEILRMCCCQWVSVGEIAAALAVTQPTVSHHLALLRSAGLVQARKEGRQVFYTVNQAQVANCCGQLMRNYAPDLPFEPGDDPDNA